MTIQQKRVVALLDVDDTLVFTNPPHIEFNDKLIDTLLENDVKDVYLFSFMSLIPKTLEDRVILIEYLQSKGLTVQGVICASDLVWNKDRALLHAFYEAVRGTRSDEEILELFAREQFKSLTHFDDAISGQAFAAVRAGIDGWDSEYAQLYQNAASAIRVYLNHNNTSEHKDSVAVSEKAHFYQMFVRNKPEWSGDVIFVDDGYTHIDAVEGMHKQLTPEHKLLTLCNRNEKQEVKNSKSFYQAIIQPFVALINAFNSYEFGRRLTHSTVKKETLQQIELALENCKNSDEVNELKGIFAEEYQQLNHHRFSFWSDAKTRSATVFDDMIEKRKEQLNAHEQPSNGK